MEAVKVWEEDWTTGVGSLQAKENDDLRKLDPMPGGLFVNGKEVGAFGEYGYGTVYEPHTTLEALEIDADRAKLAASAPDFARVLLLVEWVEVEGSYVCGACHASGMKRKHYEDCAADATLRKAGVR